MIKYVIAALVIVSLASCKKDEATLPQPTHPAMHYTTIEQEVKQGVIYRLDIDHDGSIDFGFATLLVGDPVFQVDKLQYYATSGIDRNLLNDEQDQSPVLSKGDRIGAVHTGYTWFEISSILLCQKLTFTSSVQWDGLWKAASHKYLPVQVKRNQQLFHGWVEISMDTTSGVMTIHKSGISTEEGKEVKAGF
jgi:hypothetical protein